jgi:hypothetical protein
MQYIQQTEDSGMHQLTNNLTFVIRISQVTEFDGTLGYLFRTFTLVKVC